MPPRRSVVDRGATVAIDEYRVHVELLDLWHGRGEHPDEVDEIDDRVDRDLGSATKPVEQRRQPEALDRLPGRRLGDGGDEHDPVVAQLGFDTAGADDDERAERWVAYRADEKPEPAGMLCLHDDAAQSVAEQLAICRVRVVASLESLMPSRTAPTSDLWITSATSALITHG